MKIKTYFFLFFACNGLLWTHTKVLQCKKCLNFKIDHNAFNVYLFLYGLQVYPIFQFFEWDLFQISCLQCTSSNNLLNTTGNPVTKTLRVKVLQGNVDDCPGQAIIWTCKWLDRRRRQGGHLDSIRRPLPIIRCR